MTVSVFDYEAELGACAAGDRTAFHSLYRHEAPAMRALALAILDDAGQADRLLHETFVLIWRNAAGYSASIGTARAWMYSILRYRAKAHRYEPRRMGQHTDTPRLPALTLPQDASHDTIAGVLAALPTPQLEALLQAYLHGGDLAHIAARLDRSEPDIQASIESVLTHIDEAVRA
ncbi:sigma factor [Castellaniella caeni]